MACEFEYNQRIVDFVSLFGLPAEAASRLMQIWEERDRQLEDTLASCGGGGTVYSYCRTTEDFFLETGDYGTLKTVTIPRPPADWKLHVTVTYYYESVTNWNYEQYWHLDGTTYSGAPYLNEIDVPGGVVTHARIKSMTHIFSVAAGGADIDVGIVLNNPGLNDISFVEMNWSILAVPPDGDPANCAMGIL